MGVADDVSSVNGLVTNGSKPLLESMLTMDYDTSLCRHQGIVCWNNFADNLMNISKTTIYIFFKLKEEKVSKRVFKFKALRWK